jgi:hypothetical protein
MEMRRRTGYLTLIALLLTLPTIALADTFTYSFTTNAGSFPFFTFLAIFHLVGSAAFLIVVNVFADRNDRKQSDTRILNRHDRTAITEECGQK